MDINAEAILSSINQSIVKDDVNLVGPIIVDQLEKSPDWADIGRQILLTAVTHRSDEIIEFMIDRFLWLLSGDGSYKIVIFKRAIEHSSAFFIQLFLKHDVNFKSDIGQFSYDELIDDAYKKLEEVNVPELDNDRLENLKCLRLIINSLLEYPRNGYNEHGIVLEVDKVTLEITVSSNGTLDINKPIVNNQTLLEIWINRENKSSSDGCQTSVYIQKIISSIIRYLIKHYTKLETMNAFISTNNVQAIASNDYYQQFKTECSSEITLMLAIGITGDRFVLIFDILTASNDTLAKYVTDKSFRKFIMSGLFTQLFPIYGQDIVEPFKKSTNEQTELLKSS